MTESTRSDVLIVGAGAVGLCAAWRLARAGRDVVVLERGAPGRGTSWAAGGILGFADRRKARDGYEALFAMSGELHPEDARELREVTGIDVEYRSTGDLRLVLDETTLVEMEHYARDLASQGADIARIDADACLRLEPALSARPVAAWSVKKSGQLRTPRYLRALHTAALRSGARIVSSVEAVSAKYEGERLVRVISTLGVHDASQVVLCPGAWTHTIANLVPPDSPIIASIAHTKPIRGQIALVRTDAAPPISRVVFVGPRYLVPRTDGRVLIGSTMEDEGFDARPTADGIGQLLRFGTTLVGALGSATVEATWAGLRPGTPDTRPLVGHVVGTKNVIVAVGHMRQGIHLAPGTARILVELIEGKIPSVDLTCMRPERFSAA